MKDLVKWLSSYKILVAIVDIKGSGYCNPEKSIIFVNAALPEEVQIQVVYHELSHFSHKDFVALYKNERVRGKMEVEANIITINALLNDYIEHEDLCITAVNYIDFIKYYNLNMNLEDLVQQVIDNKRQLQEPETLINLISSNNKIASSMS